MKVENSIKTFSELAKAGLNGVGVVVFVMNREGRVYMVEERLKRCGCGPPSETRKVGEPVIDNVRAVLVEEVGIGTGDMRGFYLVPGVSCLGRVPFPKEGKRVLADVVAVAYMGEMEGFDSRNEVSGLGFMELDGLSGAVRTAAHPALEFALGNRRRLLQVVNIAEQKGMPLFSETDVVGFNPNDFITQRAKLSDLYN